MLADESAARFPDRNNVFPAAGVVTRGKPAYVCPMTSGFNAETETAP